MNSDRLRPARGRHAERVLHPDGSFERIGRGCEGRWTPFATRGRGRQVAVPAFPWSSPGTCTGRTAPTRCALIRHPEWPGVSGLAAGSWDAEVCDELGLRPRHSWWTRSASTLQWTSLEPLLRGSRQSLMTAAWSRTSAWRPPPARLHARLPVTLLATAARKTRRLHELSIEVLSSSNSRRSPASPAASRRQPRGHRRPLRSPVVASA